MAQLSDMLLCIQWQALTSTVVVGPFAVPVPSSSNSEVPGTKPTRTNNTTRAGLNDSDT